MAQPPLEQKNFTTDVVIIGAGCAGLFSVFELGLLGLNTHIIDVLDAPGGQCHALYPQKPIYDIPGFVSINAQDLVDNLMRQIEPFAPTLHMGQSALHLHKDPHGGFCIETSKKQFVNARCVVIASGGGHFEPKKPPLPHLEVFEDVSVFYAITDIKLFKGKNILIAGGGDSALDWALYLEKEGINVTLVHRRKIFKASPHTLERMRQRMAQGQIQFIEGEVKALHGQDDGTLTTVDIATPSGMTCHAFDIFLPFFGLTMRPGPIEHWGLEMHNNHLIVNTETFETSQEGIFAVGDINIYPGKLKLILSAFHEAALMAQKAFKLCCPSQSNVFQYTTSSTRLKKRLGILS